MDDTLGRQGSRASGIRVAVPAEVASPEAIRKSARRDVGVPTPVPFWRWIEVLRKPRAAIASILFLVLLTVGVAIRMHFAAFLDPFEDGYQHWWIASNLVGTGEYWDRHSMMTQGNWLPLYHFASAGVLGVAGIHNLSALKVTNILISAATAVLIFLVAREAGRWVALAAVAFFVVNFIDVVVSGWSTAESLATFLVLLGYAALFHLELRKDRHLWLAAAAFGFAVLTRYEVWLVVSLLFVFLLVREVKGVPRFRALWTLVPAFVVMASFFLYSLQWGFLPEIVVNQTSTDVRYQISVGTQPSPTDLLASWWSLYLTMLPLGLMIGGAYAVWTVGRDFGSWIILVLWGFVLGYTFLQFGNPSYRYVMIGVPFLSIKTAIGLKRGIDRLPTHRLRYPRIKRFLIPGTFAVGTVVVIMTSATSIVQFWDPGFSSRVYMEPLKRAGEFVSGQPLPPGKILISESPIAAYYSGLPPNRILGSRWLPDGRSDALSFIKEQAIYVIYMGVPYYTLRTLFPELQNGTSTQDFELLYDAGGRETGTHAVFVFRVVS